MTITSHGTDLNLSVRDISALTSADALAGFLTSLGYDTDHRKPLTPEAIGLAGDSAAPIRSIEVLAEDPEGFLRVVFVQLRSLTAKSRNDLARVLGRTNVDHLLVLTSDFDTLEFVLLDKRRRQTRSPIDVRRIQVVPLSLAVARKCSGMAESTASAVPIPKSAFTICFPRRSSRACCISSNGWRVEFPRSTIWACSMPACLARSFIRGRSTRCVAFAPKTDQREVEAKAAAPTTVDPIQQTMAEEFKDALRRQSVDREAAKICIRFLAQPMGRALHAKLRKAHEEWSQNREDGLLLAAVGRMAQEFAKIRPIGERVATVGREDLDLICFEYVTG